MPQPDECAKVPVAVQVVLIATMLLYCVLAAVQSLTRANGFSPDSQNYVDVARNIAAGRGMVQSTVGFNASRLMPHSVPPVPMTSQPPLFPLAVASLARYGLSCAASALLVSSLGFTLVVLLTFLLARRTHDDRTAYLACAFLLWYQPLLFVSRFAWSETLGLAFVLCSLWLLTVRGREGRSGRLLPAAVAGLSAGLAFATRYALAPLVPVAAAWLLWGCGSRRKHAARALAFAGGAALVAGPVLLRNVILCGRVAPQLIRP